MQKYLYYLRDHNDPSFCSGCDVLLRLDDGSELPVHSQHLAQASGVCKAMLDDGVLSGTLTSEKVILPLTDCSRATAISLLSALYSRWPIQHVTKESWEAIGSVAHKLDMNVRLFVICYRCAIFLVLCEISVRHCLAKQRMINMCPGPAEDRRAM